MTDRVDFDRFAEDYNRLLAEKTSFFSPSEEYFARYKVDLIRNQITAPVSRVLEYGCGIGRNIPFLQRAFPHASIVGTDISPASLELASHDCPEATFVLENEASQRLGLFDIIFVAGVFHHVPVEQRASVAATIAGRLAPGGSLFVFEHNPYNPVTRRIVNTCPYDDDAVLLTKTELGKILEKAALTVIRGAYCLFIPPKLKVLARIEPYISLLPLGGQYWVQAQHT